MIPDIEGGVGRGTRKLRASKTNLKDVKKIWGSTMFHAVST